MKVSETTDNKSFWKIMKPLFSDNHSQTSKITFVDNDKVFLDYHEFVKTFDAFFKNPVGNLNIKKIMNSPEVNSTSPHDPVDTCI